MHAAPPLGHSSPRVHEACLSPQFTEHPPQVPRGEEGGAVQELTCPFRSAVAGPPVAVLGGPVSLEGEACGRFSFVAHAANDRATSTPAASDTPDKTLEGRILTPAY